MAYFPDLSSYAYSNRVQPGVINVGWLDGIHDYPRGIVPKHLIAKMKLLAKAPVELYRGFPICELCQEPEDVKKDRAQKLKAQRIANAKKENRPLRDFMSQLWADWTKTRMGNGEIRIRNGDIVYAAPILIVHYIEEHGYLPPSEFLRALEAAAELVPPTNGGLTEPLGNSGASGGRPSVS